MSKARQRKSDAMRRKREFYEAGVKGGTWPHPSADRKELSEYRRGMRAYYQNLDEG